MRDTCILKYVCNEGYLYTEIRGFFYLVLSNFPIEEDVMKIHYKRMELNGLTGY
jgi:hypothetical protein